MVVHRGVWHGVAWWGVVLCGCPGDGVAAVGVLWHGGVALCRRASKEL